MAGLSVSKRPAASVAPRFDEKQLASILKSLRVPKFVVRFPKWNLPAPSAAPSGRPRDPRADPRADPRLDPRLDPRADPRPAARSGKLKVYGCSCRKLFDSREELRIHHSRHPTHK